MKFDSYENPESSSVDNPGGDILQFTGTKQKEWIRTRQ
jgi:hypothetical protein